MLSERRQQQDVARPASGTKCSYRHEHAESQSRAGVAGSVQENVATDLYCTSHCGHVLLQPLCGFSRLLYPHFYEKAGGYSAEPRLQKGCYFNAQCASASSRGWRAPHQEPVSNLLLHFIYTSAYSCHVYPGTCPLLYS